jgi:hypothetical protein
VHISDVIHKKVGPVLKSSARAKSLRSVCIYSLLKIKDFMYNDLKEFHNKVTYLFLVEIQGGSVDEI